MSGQDGEDGGGDRVIEDLRRLRKGRGLQAPDLADRLGPGLVAALDLDLDPSEPDAELRRRAQDGIVEAAQVLAPDLRRAVLVGLAVSGWSDAPLLTDRIDEIARSMDRDARTARRRLDAATRQLAGAIRARRRIEETSNPYAPSGWYVESLASTLHLDLPTARLTEDRVIVAEVDGLDELTASLSMPPRAGFPTASLDVVAQAGCAVAGARRMSESHWRYSLALPRPLRAGERHRYVITFSVPDRETIEPYYVLVPLRRTRRFVAELRFGSPDDVELVWRLDGVPPSVLSDALPTQPGLTLDERGTVAVAFDEVLQGLCYGVQWRWASGPTSA